VPAVNNHGAFGRWAFLEVPDPYDALEPLRSVVNRVLIQRVREVIDEYRHVNSELAKKLPLDRIAELCRKYHVVELSIFGRFCVTTSAPRATSTYW